MNKTVLTVTIDIEVHDPTAFADAANRIRLADGRDADLTTDDLGDCAIELFDLGVSPPGCEIIESRCDER